VNNSIMIEFYELTAHLIYIRMKFI